MTDNSEQHRHRCEVRQLIMWRNERGSTWVHDYINGTTTVSSDARGRPVYKKKPGIRQTRGDAAADRLLADCRAQYKAGNRGLPDQWFDVGS